MRQEASTVIHSDGGARGNPGPAACAFVLEHDGKLIIKKSKYLGTATNNFAEYQGVLLALDFLVTQNFARPETIFFYLDSELVVKQLEGTYRIKNQVLGQMVLEIKKKIMLNNLKIFFKYVPREKNKIADFLVNEELDKAR